MSLLSALFFLQYHSFRNRMVYRLKRLKQPKYLVGGMVGALYFYFYFFRYLVQGNSGSRLPSVTTSAEDLLVFEMLGGLALFIGFLLVWIFPRSRTVLAFSEAEVAFLFPAPISRRGLIHYKLLRSQVGILFTVALLTLVTNRFGGNPAIHAIGWWLILSTVNLHLLGASFAHTILLDRGVSPTRRRLFVVALLVLVVAGTFFWARQSLPALTEDALADAASLKAYARTLLESGPAYYLLFPFRLVLAPYLAPNAASFLVALPAAFLLLVAHYVWVVRSNVAFEEASADAARKTAEKIAAMRSGNWRAGQGKTKPRRAPFVLKPHGPAFLALFWKNLIAAGQVVSPRLWIILAAVGGGLALGLGGLPEARNAFLFMGAISGMLMAWSVLVGPQVLRHDFRQDLPMTDYLKQLPLSGWQLALGQLLAPVVILTAIQWLLIVVSALLLAKGTQFGPDPGAILAIAVSAVLLLPFVNAILLLIPNAAVLAFPAWFSGGKEAQQGVEATGQRIIAVLAQLLVFSLALIPAAVAFGIVYFLLHRFVGQFAALPPAAVAAALALAAEATLGILILGRFFEKLDISAELGPS